MPYVSKRPELAPVALTAACILLLIFPIHLRARNLATLSIVGWLFVSNLIYGISAVLWADNVIKKAHIWCDICELIL